MSSKCSNENDGKIVLCLFVGHPSCLDMSQQLVKVIITYPWQCMECKTCTQCRDPFDEVRIF